MSTKPQLEQYVRTVEDFPQPGVRFYDIAQLIGNGAVFAELIETLSEPLQGRVSKVVGYDARGFVFGGAMAARLGAGLVMLRKPGKLPGETHAVSYDLEYGSTELEIQTQALEQSEAVVLVDDVIATGGTALAGIELVQRCGAEIVEFCSVIDLPHLGGSDKIAAAGVPVRTVLTLGSDN